MKAISRAIFAFFVCLLALPLAAGQFRAGSARVDLTPNYPVPLGGYGARYSKMSTGVLDPVYSRALVLDDGHTKVAIVSDDLLMMLQDLKQDIEANVKDLKLDGILLTATHTHSGPAGYSSNPVVGIAVMGKFTPQFRKDLVANISRAIREADQNLKPAKFGSAIVNSPGWSHNRRHEGGPVDPALGLIRVTDLSGKDIAFLVNYAVHPTSLPETNMKISGDIAGKVERTIEEKDPGAIALFCNGPEGDQGPACAPKEEHMACKDRVGGGLGAEAWKSASKIPVTDAVKIKLYDKKYPMPKMEIRKKCFTGVGWLMTSLGKDLKRPEAEYMAIEINDTLLYGSAAELAVEVAAQLKALHPDKKEMVFAQSNDWIGYLLTPAEYDIGQYEACMSIYGPGLEPQFVSDFKDLTKDVK